MIRRAVFLLAMVLAAPMVQAAGMSSHSVAYDVKLPADAEKGVRVEGQGTYTLTRSCQGWTLGEVYQFTVEKAASGAARPPAGAQGASGPAGPGCPDERVLLLLSSLCDRIAPSHWETLGRRALPRP